MRGEVGARVEEAAGPAREDELRADAVRRRRQQPVVVEGEETGEAAERALDPLRPRRLDRGAQPLHHLLGLASETPASP